MRRLGLAVLILFCGLVALPGCGHPPQLDGNKESFKAVDALYTAVSLKNLESTEKCLGQLKTLRDEQKLSASAYDALDSIVAEARNKDWESSQNHLGQFMEGQRR